MIKINKEDNNTYNFSLNTTHGNALFYSVRYTSKEEIRNVVSSLDLLDRQHFIIERKTDHDGIFGVTCCRRRRRHWTMQSS